MCNPEENQIDALTEELALEKCLSELRRHDAEVLREALMLVEPHVPHLAASNEGAGRYVCGAACPSCALKMALDQTSPERNDDA